MNCFRISFGLIMLSVMAFGTAVAQETTEVTVRVKAKDANFIGSSMGGAMITIKNAETDEVLAKGLTEGSTGSTEKLVKSPKKRYEQLYTEGSAKFVAHLDIDKPVFATISATSTYRNEQEVTSSTQMWLIPGRDITGDGIILEIPGFVVDIVDVQPYKTEGEGMGVKFKTKIVMMCGCPTRPNGTWDSSEFKMEAVVKENGTAIQTIPLEFSGERSIYKGSFTVKQPGSYKLMIYAFDPRTENSGMDVETISLQ